MASVLLIVPVVSSKLALDRFGRRITIVTSPTILELPVGMTFRDLGNDMPSDGAGFGWLGARAASRHPSPREQVEVRPPYSAAHPRRSARQESDEDDLADEEAIKLARVEQERTPADLLNGA